MTRTLALLGLTGSSVRTVAGEVPLQDLFHAPHCELARRAFDIEEEAIEFECICWREKIIPHGWSTVSFHGGVTMGTYIRSGKAAIAQTEVGIERIF